MVPLAGDGDLTAAARPGTEPALPAVPVVPVPRAGSDRRSGPQPVELRELRARGRIRGSSALLGPAFVAAVWYIEPGNCATNRTAGDRFGHAVFGVIGIG